MPSPAPARAVGPPARESTPVGGTRHSAQQLAKANLASPSDLLQGLYDKLLVPVGEEASVDSLANALVLLSKQKEQAKNTNLQITLRNIAALLKVASNPLEKIQKTIERAVEDSITPIIHRIEESLTKVSGQLEEFRAEYTKSSSELVEKVGESRSAAQEVPIAQETGANGGESGGTGGSGGRRSYAAAVSQRLEWPAPVVTTRVAKQDRQILMDCEATEGGQVSESEGYEGYIV
ncbi:hypothetical protein FRC07_012850 [Ceratobasidium sp. 392]|nr:hypothetical protein FRC07_012850 [Ceratobasidium sp. 392]